MGKLLLLIISIVLLLNVFYYRGKRKKQSNKSKQNKSKRTLEDYNDLILPQATASHQHIFDSHHHNTIDTNTHFQSPGADSTYSSDSSSL